MPFKTTTQIQDSRVAACGLISGALLGLCFPPTDWSLLAWVALAPLGVVFASPTMPLRSWAGVYLGGLICHLWVFDWIRTLYGGVGLAGNHVSGWLITGQLGALLFCLMVAAGRRGVLTAKLPMTVTLPLVWICYEYLQHYLTANFNQTGTRLLSLAYTQADQTTVAQMADLGGAGLISFVVAAVNGFLYDATKWILTTTKSDRQWLHAMRLSTVPLAMIAVVVYGQTRISTNDSKQGPTVCLMGKEDLPPLLDETRILSGHQSPPAVPGSAYPDLFVWPELAYHHTLITTSKAPAALAALEAACPLANGDVQAYSQTVRQYLEQAASKFQAGILIGCERLEASGEGVQRYNCLAYSDPVDGLVGCYDKRHLAPFIEFVPTSVRWLQTANCKGYTHGQSATSFVLHAVNSDQTYKIGCGLCYDVAFEEHFRQQLRNGDVDCFILSGSEAADKTGCMSQMLLRMAQLRAIETRRPIIRNTHLGFSGMIDANGRVVEYRNREELGIPWQLGAVPLDRRASLYSRWGDWLSPMCLGGLFIALIVPLASVIRMPSSHFRRVAKQSLPLSSSARLSSARRQAFSLLELLAVVAILGTISALIIPRVTASAATAKEATDSINRAKINAAVERWYLEQGVWPANDLSDIGVNPDYFPEGIPPNPVNGFPYTLNATTHRVIVWGGGGK